MLKWASNTEISVYVGNRPINTNLKCIHKKFVPRDELSSEKWNEGTMQLKCNTCSAVSIAWSPDMKLLTLK